MDESYVDMNVHILGYGGWPGRAVLHLGGLHEWGASLLLSFHVTHCTTEVCVCWLWEVCVFIVSMSCHTPYEWKCLFLMISCSINIINPYTYTRRMLWLGSRMTTGTKCGNPPASYSCFLKYHAWADCNFKAPRILSQGRRNDAYVCFCFLKHHLYSTCLS